MILLAWREAVAENKAMLAYHRLGLAALAAGLLAIFHARAGVVSLDPQEIQQLRTLVRSDPAAAAVFESLRAAADRTLIEQPDPIQKVTSEGHLASDPRRIESRASLHDLSKMEALGWAWAVTGDSRYFDRLDLYLTAWARVNKPDGDPINESNFDSACVAYDLARGSMPPQDRQLVDAWLQGKADKLMGKNEPDNNWGAHAAKMVGLIGLTIQDPKAVDWAIHRFKHQIKVEFRANGATSDFYERDALFYHLYSITPLLELARAEARAGLNLFDYGALGSATATLHAGVDFVAPFAEGAQTHIEFLHSASAFDHARAKDGEPAFIPHPWDPKSAVEMFVLAAWFQPKYGALAAQLEGMPGARYVNWDSVLNAVSSPAAAQETRPSPNVN